MITPVGYAAKPRNTDRTLMRHLVVFPTVTAFAFGSRRPLVDNRAVGGSSNA